MLSLNEQIKRMKHLSLIGEANYKLVDNINEDDPIPDEVYSEPKLPIEDEPSKSEEDNDVPDTEMPLDTPKPEGMVEPNNIPQNSVPPVKSHEEVQNDILKLNVTALEKMQGVMKSIENTVDGLNNRVSKLNSDVEEVKEPTSVEKLKRRKNDSHPYYYNLNDLWSGDSFRARIDQTGEQGIVQLEDGTYMANFDDLPKHSDQEIRNSFNK